jgi:hypothetical protein
MIGKNLDLCAVAALVLALPARATAQGYPEKPIKMIVPFPPCGPRKRSGLVIIVPAGRANYFCQVFLEIMRGVVTAHFPLARSIPSTIIRFACAASAQRLIFTHLPGSRSL